MKSLTTSPLLKNIIHFDLDNRVGKLTLNFQGMSQHGERRRPRPGHLAEIIDTRLYIAGDPVKEIDWKVWGKLEELRIKLREGTARANIRIVLDDSNSMKVNYDKEKPSKWISALTLAYALGKYAIKSQDRLQIQTSNQLFTVFQDAKLSEILLSLDSKRADTKSTGSQDFHITNTSGAKTNYWIYLSDFFMDQDILEKWIKERLDTKQHIIFVQMLDSREADFSFNGEKNIKDPESLRSQNDIFLRTDSIREKYLREYNSHFHLLRQMCRAYSIPWIFCGTDDDPIEIIHRHFVQKG